MSYKVTTTETVDATTGAAVVTAVAVPATLGDIVGTLVTPSAALTGMYKYVQMGVVGVGAAMFMNKRHTGSMTNFGSSAA